MAIHQLQDKSYKIWNTVDCNDLKVCGITTKKVLKISQATSINTQVVVPSDNTTNNLIITTQTVNLNPLDSTSFNISWNGIVVDNTDFIIANILDYSGTYLVNGIPHITVNHIAGSFNFDIWISNLHPSVNVNGTLELSTKLEKHHID